MADLKYGLLSITYRSALDELTNVQLNSVLKCFEARALDCSRFYPWSALESSLQADIDKLTAERNRRKKGELT